MNNRIMSIGKLIPILLLSALLTIQTYSIALAQVPHFLMEEEIEESNVIYGRWIKSGRAVDDFPVCYQLWQCDKSHLEEEEIIKNRLPKGEWGLCSNYLEPNPDNPKLCLSCDVAPPQELCY